MDVDYIAKAQGKERRKLILELVHKIVSGEIDSYEVPLDELFQLYTSERDRYQLGGPRRTYISPSDRSSYNYGYMTISDMQAGDPNIW